MDGPAILVVGAGPGVGGSVARRFAEEGYAVGLVSLMAEELDDLGAALAADGFTVAWRVCDITDAEPFRAAVDELAAELGGFSAVHFNPSAFRMRDPLHLTVPELLHDVALGVGALLTTVQAARPHLAAGARITATGSVAADRPWHEACGLGVQKAGMRNLVRSVDTTLAPEGIRAVSVTVHGVLAPHDPQSPFHPRQVADAIWRASRQEESQWASEVPHPPAGAAG